MQTAIDHTHHERQVAYRGMLEAVSHGNDLPRKALRRLKFNSMADYAKTVATNLQGDYCCHSNMSIVYHLSVYIDVSIERELLDYHIAHEEFIKFIEPFTVSKTLLITTLPPAVAMALSCRHYKFVFKVCWSH